MPLPRRRQPRLALVRNEENATRYTTEQAATQAAEAVGQEWVTQEGVAARCTDGSGHWVVEAKDYDSGDHIAYVQEL
jgi:hypothetical protein